jgi:hypothetical protein
MADELAKAGPPDDGARGPVTEIGASNSLTDLAARVRIEHEAASAALRDGLKHAIAAGKLLIEAKAQIDHGQWLPWLVEHCLVSERSAQSYMRVARELGKLEESKSATRCGFELSRRPAVARRDRLDRQGFTAREL